VQYGVLSSRVARKLRVRIGLNGVEVTRPTGKTSSDVESFLTARTPWVLDQLRRVERLRNVRRPERILAGQILFRGVPTPIRLEQSRTRAHGNKVAILNGEIVIRRGEGSRTPPARSLERWLRKQAHDAIETNLAAVAARLKQIPARVYVMGQRTKWGTCSARRNLSFN
jgi:predicted metal-dependent hydrolase